MCSIDLSPTKNKKLTINRIVQYTLYNVHCYISINKTCFIGFEGNYMYLTILSQ